MIEFKSVKPKIAIDYNNPSQVEISFKADKSVASIIENLPNDKDLVIQIKEYREKRTLSQNAYFWVLVGELAKVVGVSSLEVYQQFIKDYGVYEILPIRDDAVESFIYKWGKNGMGWFCDTLGKSKIDNYTNLVVYYGSSTYNTKEMSRIIDAIVDECEKNGISTLSKEEIYSLENNN